jgi:hypothetical protein
MDERRDLVDREEKPMTDDEILAALRGWCATGTTLRVAADRIEALLAEVAALRSVECPRGWTRDEVLAELDADPDAVCEWLNPVDGGWYQVARPLIEAWHPEVRRYDVRVVRVAPEPEWVPLTQLVGRTIDKCDEEVQGYASDAPLSWRNKKWQWFPFPEGTLNLETGQVAVRPKAAT